MTSLGQDVRKVLSDYMQLHGLATLGRLNGQIVQELIDEALSSKWIVKPERVKRVVLPEADWMESLRKDPANQGLDVHLEHKKMAFWCKNHRKQPTRGRFEEWLLRADRPISGAGSPSESPKTSLSEPTGFQEWVADHMPTAMWDGLPWGEWPHHAQLHVKTEMAKQRASVTAGVQREAGRL